MQSGVNDVTYSQNLIFITHENTRMFGRTDSVGDFCEHLSEFLSECVGLLHNDVYIENECNKSSVRYKSCSKQAKKKKKYRRPEYSLSWKTISGRTKRNCRFVSRVALVFSLRVGQGNDGDIIIQISERPYKHERKGGRLFSMPSHHVTHP